jgi:hypothetical protein
VARHYLLFRHGRTFNGKTTWRGRQLRRLDGQNFAHSARRFAYQESSNAMRITAWRIDRLQAAFTKDHVELVSGAGCGGISAYGRRRIFEGDDAHS